MKEEKEYKLGKFAGPSANFSGYILLVAGLATVYFSLTALFLIFLGAALAFSYNRLLIKPEQKLYCSQLLLIGFIPLGKWKSLKETETLVLKQFKGIQSTSSLSNRISSTSVDDFRIFLTSEGRNNKLLFAIFENEEEAKAELTIIKNIFNID